MSKIEADTRTCDLSENESKNVHKYCKSFSRTTSSHGIPLIASSKSCHGRLLWTILFLGCFATALFQAYFLITKFIRFDIVVHIELKFDAAEFPAVTICNINPYKKSLIGTVGNMKQQMKAFSHQKRSSKKVEQRKRISKEIQREQHNSRRRRFLQWRSEDLFYHPAGHRTSRQVSGYEPIKAYCQCHRGRGGRERDCVPLLEKVGRAQICYCFRDMASPTTVWPCYHTRAWQATVCDRCSSRGRCHYPSDESLRTANRSEVQECLCQLVTLTCVVKPLAVSWHGDQTPTTTTPSPAVLQHYGFLGETDENALASIAKDAVVYEMANIDLEKRINVSYTIEDMIFMCSFDQQSCDIHQDFKRTVTPNFGNCYTFNHDANSNRTSSRSGPIYGLRLLTYANVSDYMPMTESAGFRIAIHQPTERPFPDTVGYNAPTGIKSSFGLKLKKISRMSKPYGDCMPVGSRPPNYIYEEVYTAEGCYRSCFQNEVFARCNCGDPKYPRGNHNLSYCALKIESEKKCVDKVTAETAGGYQKIRGCDCRQPCEQSYYIITYSAARWPAHHYEIGSCKPDDDACLLDYRTNAAFLEIYYEQSNFEVAEEREAYGITSLIADFGGQLGLWMGFSVITILEWCILIFNLFTVCCRHGYIRKSNNSNNDNNDICTPNKEDGNHMKWLADAYPV